MSSDFIYLFLKRLESAVLIQNEPCSNDMSLAELCGHCPEPPPVSVPQLLTQVLGGQSRAERPTHVLINLLSLKDDLYSLPGQAQDLYCCMLRLRVGFFIICWMLGVLKGAKREKQLLCSRSWFPPACQANKEITSACPECLKHCVVQICG